MRSISLSCESVNTVTWMRDAQAYLVEFFRLLHQVVEEGGILQLLLLGELLEVFLRFGHLRGMFEVGELLQSEESS